MYICIYIYIYIYVYICIYMAPRAPCTDPRFESAQLLKGEIRVNPSTPGLTRISGSTPGSEPRPGFRSTRVNPNLTFWVHRNPSLGSLPPTITFRKSRCGQRSSFIHGQAGETADTQRGHECAFGRSTAVVFTESNQHSPNISFTQG